LSASPLFCHYFGMPEIPLDFHANLAEFPLHGMEVVAACGGLCWPRLRETTRTTDGCAVVRVQR